jgi:CHASE3 domain sensor protein
VGECLRGHLLTNNTAYLENISRLRALFEKHSQELADVLASDKGQRDLVLKVRENIRKSLTAGEFPELRTSELADRNGTNASLDGRQLAEAHQILETIRGDKQTELNHRVREQEWAIQSTQVLNFVSKMERAVCDMEKEKRGYLLTGESARIDSTRERPPTSLLSTDICRSTGERSDPRRAAQADSRIARELDEQVRLALDRGETQAGNKVSETALDGGKRGIDQFCPARD